MPRHPKAGFYAFAYPAPPSFAQATASPAGARWDAAMGEFLLDWDDVRAASDPRATAVQFGRSMFATPARCASGMPLQKPASKASLLQSGEGSQVAACRRVGG